MPRYSALIAAAVLCGCTRSPAPVDAGTGPNAPRKPAASSELPGGSGPAQPTLVQVVLDVPGMH
ncbi:MAG: hypothetical protein K6T86_02260 [Pirellulales bacterium]|nr:hypothetical protein [Pirellulales bacterium]